MNDSTLSAIRKMYFSVRRDEHKEILKDYRGRKYGFAAIEATCEHLGKPVPKELVEERERRAAESKANKENCWTPERREQYSEALKKRWAASNSDNSTPLWAQTMLLNQAKLISQLDELMDAVIPKYARDVVESNEKLDTHLVQLINKLS